MKGFLTVLRITFNVCDILYISRKHLKRLYVLADKSNQIMIKWIENKHMQEEKC